MRELLPLLLLMLGAWLLNVLPVVHYGALMPIGHNWDVEFYLPLADYLKGWSYRTLAEAPANPLLNVIMFERIAARAMGATYAQAMADLVGGWEAWDSWVPMLALLRALTLPGLYALLRDGLIVRAPAALLGVALAAANSLLLWTTYNSFGMGIGALALLPVTLLCTLVALEEPDRRAVMAAALLLGGLTCVYWPMLQAYGAVALLCGLLLLWERRRGGWAGVVARGALILAGGALLGVLAHLRAPVAWLGVFAAQTPSMGIFDFISPPVIAGTAPFSHGRLPPPGAFENLLAWGGLAAALLLLLHGAWRGAARRGLALGVVLGSIVYLLGLRFAVRFPYGYLRGASYSNTLLLGVAGAGLLPCAASLSRKARMWAGFASTGLAILLLAGTSLAVYRTYAVYAPGPAVFGLETVAVRAAAAKLEQPGPVYLSGAPEMRGTYLGAWAYALKRHELLGIMETGFGRLINMRPGAAPVYGVLQHDEDPREHGLDPAAQTWKSERAAIYAAPPNRIAWLSGRPSAYSEGTLFDDDTTYSRAQFGVGSYLEARPDQALVLYANEETLSLEPLAARAGGQREVNLALASFTAQTVELDLGDERRRLELPAGYTIYHTGAVTVPTRVSLRGTAAPVVLRWASLDRISGASGGARLEPVDDTVLLNIASEPRPDGASVSLQTTGDEVLKVAIEIYQEVGGYGTEAAHYASALFPLAQQGTHELAMDLATPQITLDGAPLQVKMGDLRDGKYFAALWIYQGEQVRRRLPFLRFERRNGIVDAATPLDLNAAFVRVAPPAQPLAARFGDGIVLRAFELSATQLRAGGRLRASLLWQADRPQSQLYLVFVQLLDDNDRKIAQWDGAAGGDWWPTPAWQAGQRIRQDIPLQIAPDAPPGTYRLIAGLYDPATGARLQLRDGGDILQLGTVEVVP